MDRIEQAPAPGGQTPGVSNALDLATGQLDLDRGVFTPRSGPPVRLTGQERALLTFLSRRAMHDVSREDLLRDVLGYADGVTSRAVDDTVKRLRAKIEAIPSRPFHLVGVRGTGYRFVPLDAATPESVRSTFQMGSRIVDLDRLVVRSNGEESPLSSTEGRFLEALARREGRPVSPDELLREVWGVRDRGQRRLVDKLVYRLRLKVEDDPSVPRHLVTVRGRGLALAEALPITHPATSTPATGLPERPRVKPPSFVVHGRSKLVEAVQAATATPGLVTVHGPAGVGKTTLIQVTAAALAKPCAMIDLEACTTDIDVLAEVARAAGVPVDPEVSAEELWSYLAAGPRIWYLEHPERCLAAAARFVEAARAQMPDLAVVVTSRHPLGAPGERILPVEPLAPEDALAMLHERAAAQGVEIDPADPRAARLVESVDRLPLAIDLAVPRLRWMEIDALLTRIERSLDLLRRDGPGAVRSQSLRSSLAWSWDALSEAERRLLVDLAALYGRFTLSAAEGALADRHGANLFAGMQRLTDFSLLRREGACLSLYHGVREMVHEVAPDACAAASEAIQPRVGKWYADLFIPQSIWDEPTPNMYPGLMQDLDGALAWLEHAPAGADQDRTLRWVLALLHRSGDLARIRPWWNRRSREAPGSEPGLAMRLVLLIPRIVESGSRYVLYRSWAKSWTSDPAVRAALLGEMLIDAADRGQADLMALREEVQGLLRPDLPLEAEAYVRLGLGWASFRLGDLDAAWSALQEALSLARLVALPWLESRAAYNLAGVCHAEARLPEAESFIQQARSRLTAANRAVLDDQFRDMLGLVWLDQGRLAPARAVHEQLYAQYHEAGDTEATSRQANRLGTLDGVRGDHASAARWFEFARAGFEATGNAAWSAGCTYNLGECAWNAGQLLEARAHYTSALAAYERLGRRVHQGVVLAALGRLAAADGDAQAATLYERALELLDQGRARRQAAATRARLALEVFPNDAARALALTEQAVTDLEKIGPSTDLIEATLAWLEVRPDQAGSAVWGARKRRANELARSTGLGTSSPLSRRLSALDALR